MSYLVQIYTKCCVVSRTCFLIHFYILYIIYSLKNRVKTSTLSLQDPCFKIFLDLLFISNNANVAEMAEKLVLHSYYNSFSKRLLDKAPSLLGLILSLPLFLIIAILIKLGSNGPSLFKQKRVGKDGKVFTLVKFRTMMVGAQVLQSKYKHLNEVDGPVFKIRDDPRYTKFGKLLARTGLDELPQLINVIKGEMSLVEPRPLPVNEAKKLTKAQKIRELVKPGITSSWVISGAHDLKFNEWMRLDKVYVENASLSKDLEILFKTFLIVTRQTIKQLAKKTKF